MAEKQMSTIQLYTNDGNMTAVTPLLDYQQMIPTKNKQYVTEDKGHAVSYGVGKYVVDADTIRTLDYNNIHAFKTQLQTTKYYPLTVLCDSQGYMYSVIPDGTFATEDYVRTSIENIISVDSEVNLSGYATIKYVDDAIADALKDYDGGAGSESVETLTLFVYCSSENVVPDKPVGGSWDKDDKGNIVINYPDGWSSLSNVDSNYPVYMSSSLQMIGGKIISDWSEPILISGVPGEPGKDGNGIEFKYTLTKNNDAPNNPNIEPDIWTDDPTGISMEYQFEWISYRKTGDSGTAWSDAALWSKWGVDGKDGKDIEYIYYRNNGEVVTNPTPTDNIYENEDYQTDGFYPEPWTTDPQGVNKEYTHEWVCSRKKINGFWGSFSDPASWAIKGPQGQQGDNGYSIKTLYRAVDHTISGEELSSQVDNFRNNDDFSLATSNGWNAIMPTNYDSTDWVWSISAYVDIDNKIIKVKDVNGNEIGWQGPILVTGKGKDATPLNYNIYVYANLTDRPNKPTVTNDTNITYPIDNVWYDYPDNDSSDIESWWQCIGVVSGATNNITWGNVIPLNGKDGVAKDGKMYETRMSIATISNDSLSWPEFNATNRIPGDEWFLANKFSPETLSDDTCIVQTVALIDYSDNIDGSLIDTWCTPYRISGERGQQGPQGETGPTGGQGPIGLSGTPGIDFVIKYCRGTIKDTNNDGVEDNVLDVSDVNDFDSSGWVDDVNDIYNNIDASFPYIYCVQGRKTYSRKGNTNEFDEQINWGTPFRLSGTNGLDGLDGSTGKNGQIIYPAGVYNIDKEYVLDDMKAPYVLDTNDKNYYVLNVERWKGTEQNDNMPSTDNTGAWTKFEQFEAIYADIGMFRSALVGSAVFNGDYMFSQNGLDTSGNLSNNYENFDKNDPYGDNATFKPTFCVNLRTGQMWLSNGNVMFNSDGSGELAGGQIHWTADGVLVLPQVIVFNGFYDFDDLSITALKYSLDIENANIDESAKVNIELLKSDGTIYKTLDITDEILNDQHVSGIIQMGDILYDDIPIKMQLKINNEVIKTIALNVPDIIYKRLNVSIDDSSFKTPSSWGLTVQPITYKFNSDDIVYGKIKKINDYTFNIDGTINDMSTNMSFSLRSTAPYRNDVSIISSNCDVDKTSFDFDTDDGSGTSGTINISNIKNGANVTIKPVFNMNNVVKDASIKRLLWNSAVNDNILIGPFNCVPADASVAEIILHSNTSDSTFSSVYSVQRSNDLTGKVTYVSSSKINLDALNNSYTNENGYIKCSIKLSDSNNNVLIDMDNVLIPKANTGA